MAVDRYTKLVLTVIAACLVWLSVGGPSLVSPVSAQNTGHEKVVLAGWVDESGFERRLPSMFKDDTPEQRRQPRALPMWQENK
jgi:hypothetical protein